MTRYSVRAQNCEPAQELLSHAADAPAGNIRRLRLHTRRRVNIPVIAHSKGAYFHAVVKDVSLTGAGLLVHRSLDLDDLVELHFAGGRKIEGYVRWRRMEFCGVEFSEPLKLQSQLPSEGELLAQPQASESFHEPPLRERPAGRIVTAAKWFDVLRDAIVTYAGNWRQHQQSTQKRKMIERACRKQGHSWLADLDRLSD